MDKVTAERLDTLKQTVAEASRGLRFAQATMDRKVTELREAREALSVYTQRYLRLRDELEEVEG